MVIDRARSWVTLMASAEGGIEIEEVAARAPEKILREPIDPSLGIQAFQARKIAFGLDLPKLLEARWVVASRVEQEFRVDVDDSQEVIQLVRDEPGRLCGVLQSGAPGQVLTLSRQV